MLNRGKTFYTSDVSLLRADGKLVKTPLPDTADYQDVIGGRLIAKLNKPLGAFPAGAIVAYALADIAAGRDAAPELVMAPSKSQAIEEVSASDNILWVKALDDVSGKLFALRRECRRALGERSDAAGREQHGAPARCRRRSRTWRSPPSRAC